MLGVIAYSRGDFKDAERSFERAVQLNPNYTEALLNLMVAYNDLGRYDDARKIYSKVRKVGSAGGEPDPYAKGKIANMHADLSQAYQDAGMPPEAIIELEKAVRLCPTFADLRTRLAILYRDSGDVASAKGQLEAAKLVNPNYLQARTVLAVMLLSEGRNPAAIEELQAVLERDPDNKNAQMYLRLARSGPSADSRPPEGTGGGSGPAP
jgi:Tfp pilus assembly protein PilF